MSLFDQIKSTKLFIQNYKSFGTDEQGFDGIEPINIIVGRNNSGKSALLDLIQFSCGNYQFPPSTQNRAGLLKVLLETPLSEEIISRCFSRGTSGGPINGDHFEFGKQYIGRQIKIGMERATKSFGAIDTTDIAQLPTAFWQPLANSVEAPFAGKAFKRLGADRDITPEGNGDNVGLAQNGLGLTNVIQRLIRSRW
jgi:hypothetical protein